MHKHVLVLTISALVLAYGATAIAQGPMMPRTDQQQTQGHDGSMGQGGMMCGMMGQGDMMGRGMMGQGGMMGRGMMGGGMMGGAMGPPVMMRMIFALMDSDGDGTIELPEFQAAHERIFKAMDSNKDGKLTREEMQAFMQGTRRSVPPQQQ
jgi:EF hand